MAAAVISTRAVCGSPAAFEAFEPAANLLPEGGRGWGPMGGAEAAPEAAGALPRPQDRVAQWRKDRMRTAQLDTQRSLQELAWERAGLESLHADLASTAQQTEAAMRSREEDLQIGEALRQDAEATAQRAGVAAQTRDELRKARRGREKELREAEDALVDQCRQAQSQRADLDKFLALYADRLGLRIARVAPQTVRFTFTLLDREDLSREFSFSLGLSDSNKYRVQDCDPQPHDFGDLLARLNADTTDPSALPAFVCGMRKAFKDVAGQN